MRGPCCPALRLCSTPRFPAHRLHFWGSQLSQCGQLRGIPPGHNYFHRKLSGLVQKASWLPFILCDATPRSNPPGVFCADSRADFDPTSLNFVAESAWERDRHAVASLSTHAHTRHTAYLALSKCPVSRFMHCFSSPAILPLDLFLGTLWLLLFLKLTFFLLSLFSVEKRN